MEETRLMDKPSLTLTRDYAAPPERLWRAWTDAEALKQWWGPAPGEPVALAELDVRVGGRFRICFGGADGNEHECAGVYTEVVKPKKLAFTWTWPRTTAERESLVTILFNAKGGGTELLFRHERLFSEKVRDDHRRGWSGLLEQLDGYLASIRATEESGS
jgi:uncharacterized protein YndB with AHSA1/START domain